MRGVANNRSIEIILAPFIEHNQKFYQVLVWQCLSQLRMGIFVLFLIIYSRTSNLRDIDFFSQIRTSDEVVAEFISSLASLLPQLQTRDIGVNCIAMRG